MTSHAISETPHGFRVMRVFHPTAQVPDLARAEQWFERAFGRKSTSLSAMLPSTPEYPTEYSTFTVIRDVFFDTIDPKLHFINGRQRYPAVQTPGLRGIGWYVDGMTDLYHALRRNGFRCMDLSDNIAQGDEPPLSPGGGVVTFFVVPEDAGMQYQFFREGPFPLDPRATPGWALGPVDADDPLGIEHCSHHTILTSQPERALRFAVDALGGTVVHRGRNEVLGATSVFVAIADTLIEYAVPDPGTPARADLAARAPNDSYYAITWKVADLEGVERHLATLGVGIRDRSATTIVAQPEDSLGVPWGFTTTLQPGDPRVRAHGGSEARRDSTTAPGSVLVVGASAGGLCTAEALRRGGYKGRITLIGDEPHVPYDRPPLSKQVLHGAWEPERAALRPSQALAALDAEFVLGESAVELDVKARSVRTASGRRFEADAIVIATGAHARRLPGQAKLAGVHVLRSLDDTLALREALRTSSRLVVVGEGVLGSEIAATACTLGLDVTLVGPLAAPMAAQIGPLASGLLATVHKERGVSLRLGTGVDGLTSEGGCVTGVRLANDEVLPADVVVVAIGASPATGWLEGSGLRIDNGIVCDSRCRAADGIYAVGDVARWHHEKLGRLTRFENRTNATEQAEAVAACILGKDTPYAPVPYFWTDQFDVKIQVFGAIAADAQAEIVEGDFSARRFVARYTSDGVVTGVLGWNMPKQVRQHRQDVVDATHLSRTSA
ncbi:FAD-dependent oxidoreductase [Paraburkholderia caffeinilytica]|uniref:VOC domain-containing protein n=1 Tax=Paraburkholderia caffeinilytica TaxID=1761016 RepID=A0ABQ1NES1_9BURK|nr:FAD-dependent oxidoreductase [Paraburkholderia caffeinilytica]GGC67440.1 hypothetical protein GCM10011400_64160 [Paraburkholderia caffeinilytica]CAB3804220.1 3-phenylpropionate/cinnamic acid dioxygenase ferredoxin--NAD(+) reductase component [Paraburkholderia caffeinilytica]